MLGARGDTRPQDKQASKRGMQRKIESDSDSCEEGLHAPAALRGGSQPPQDSTPQEKPGGPLAGASKGYMNKK